MIIWNWLIAKSFSFYKDNNNVIIFASWVSNSQNQDKNLFEREISLLKEILNINKNKLFIYFSTCSITDKTLETKYIKHKIKAEKIIKNNKNNNFLIIRIPNPIWFTKNPNTLLNYFVNRIKLDEIFTVLSDAKRNIIDVEDLFKISDYIINNWLFINETINIANTKNYTIFDIIISLEKIIWKKAIYKIKQWWGEPEIDLKKIKEVIDNCWIDFNKNYLDKLIQKYYS